MDRLTAEICTGYLARLDTLRHDIEAATGTAERGNNDPELAQSLRETSKTLLAGSENLKRTQMLLGRAQRASA